MSSGMLTLWSVIASCLYLSWFGCVAVFEFHLSFCLQCYQTAFISLVSAQHFLSSYSVIRQPLCLVSALPVFLQCYWTAFISLAPHHLSVYSVIEQPLSVWLHTTCLSVYSVIEQPLSAWLHTTCLCTVLLNSLYQPGSTPPVCVQCYWTAFISLAPHHLSVCLQCYWPAFLTFCHSTTCLSADSVIGQPSGVFVTVPPVCLFQCYWTAFRSLCHSTTCLSSCSVGLSLAVTLSSLGYMQCVTPLTPFGLLWSSHATNLNIGTLVHW